MEKIERMIVWHLPGILLSFEEYGEILKDIPVYTILDIRFFPYKFGVPEYSSILGKRVVPVSDGVYIWNYCAWCGSNSMPVKERCSKCGGWI